jgi:hypothetical protein
MRSTRCSPTRWARPLIPRGLGKRVNELYGQGNLEIFDYQVVEAPGPGDDPAYAWR